MQRYRKGRLDPKGHDRRRGRWLTGLALMLCAAAVAAQSPTETGDDGDPPTRVARLSYIAGDVGFLPAGTDDWRDVSVNRPLARGDRLSTGADARVELDFGDASVRLDSDTEFGFLDLDDWQVRAELPRGTADLSVRQIPDGQDVEIDTPTLAVVVDRPAHLRVDVAADGASTRVSVSSGSAVAYGTDGARRVLETGMRYRFTDATLAATQVEPIGGGDAFDAWSRERERRFVASTSRQHVPAGTIGYQDLDAHGDWRSEPAYGHVWFPDDVGADWAPYRNGHWAWVAPWGWTWVDDAAWGFAPFHYGRWSMFGGRWGWIPGPVGLHAVYAPALVTFFGGSGWSVSLGIGSRPVGWYPLGPGMLYSPWYRASRHYYARVNRNNLYLRNHGHRRGIDRRIERGYDAWSKPERLRTVHYLGQRPPHGITVASGRAVAEGRPVRAARLQVKQARLRHAPLLRHGLQVRPDRKFRAAARPLDRQVLPPHEFKRKLVKRNPPHPRAAVPFHVEADAARAARSKRALQPRLPQVRLLDGHRRDVERDAGMQRRHSIDAVRAQARRWRAPTVHKPAQRPPPVKPVAGLPHVPRLHVAGPRRTGTSTRHAATAQPRHETRRAPRAHAPVPRPRPWMRERSSPTLPSRPSPRPPERARPHTAPTPPQRVRPAPSRAPVRWHAAPSRRPATPAPVQRKASRAAPRTGTAKPVRWNRDKR